MTVEAVKRMVMAGKEGWKQRKALYSCTVLCENVVFGRVK